MSRSDDEPNTTGTNDTYRETRKAIPWTVKFRKIVLVVLGSAAFALFLLSMWLKLRGAAIAYQDMFLLLLTSGTLLGVNFGLELLGNIAGKGGGG